MINSILRLFMTKNLKKESNYTMAAAVSLGSICSNVSVPVRIFTVPVNADQHERSLKWGAKVWARRPRLSHGGWSDKITGKSLHVFSNNWIYNIAQFLIGVYIVRNFGAAGKGIYSLTLSSASTVALLLSLGLNNAAVYHIKKGELTPRRAIKLILQSGLIAAMVAGVFLFTLKDILWATLFKGLEFSACIFLVVVAFIPVIVIMLFLTSYYLASHETRKHQSLVATSSCMVFGVTIIMTKFIKSTVEVALIAALLTQMAYIIWFSIDVVCKSIKTTTKPHLSIRNLYSYGLRGHLGGMSNTVLSRMDLILVAAYVSPEILGYYSVSRFLYQAVISIPLASNGLLLGVYCEQENAAACKMNWEVFCIMSVLLIVIAIPAFLFGGDLMVLFYGKAFVRAVPSLNILLIAAIFIGASSSFNSLFLACNWPGLTSKIAIVSGAVKCLMTIVLVQHYSIEGAASATVVGAVVIFCMRLIYGRKSSIVGRQPKGGLVNVN